MTGNLEFKPDAFLEACLPGTSDRMRELKESIGRLNSQTDEVRAVLLLGETGVGKTYIAKKLIEHLALSSEEWDVVQFHPSYSYEDFVLGFRPFITSRGDLNYALQAGPLLRLAGHAQRYPSRKQVVAYLQGLGLALKGSK